MSTGNRLGSFVAESAAKGALVVQPRMGVSDPARMREGLVRVRDCQGPTVGTITLDSFTRVGDHESARRAITERKPLNGFPLVAHGSALTRSLLDGVQSDDFPVQVRHGSALPTDIFETMIAAGVDATEGGPVSYCLPYSRVPLSEATQAWRRCAELAAPAGPGRPGLHVETFGGCLLGQLCPPGLLVAMSVLEGMFFAQNGVRSISLSYAQQTNLAQDISALRALRRLGRELVQVDDLHVVLYTFMGVYPASELGSYRLLADSASIAHQGGAERLIVKTPAEAHRIPSFADNVNALEFAHVWSATRPVLTDADEEAAIAEEALRLITATLALDSDVGEALVKAFDRGLLDIPFCLHPDNRNATRAAIDQTGRLRWAEVGSLPLPPPQAGKAVTASRLLLMLEHNRSRLDRLALRGWNAAEGAIA